MLTPPSTSDFGAVRAVSLALLKGEVFYLGEAVTLGESHDDENQWQGYVAMTPDGAPVASFSDAFDAALWLVDQPLPEPPPTSPLMLSATCRVCSCTDHRACPGGCWWVEPDLCSACAPDGLSSRLAVVVAELESLAEAAEGRGEIAPAGSGLEAMGRAEAYYDSAAKCRALLKEPYPCR